MGANIRRSEATEEALQRRAASKVAADQANVPSPAAPTAVSSEDSGEKKEEKKYVHKVIGGMVVKVENTEWKYEE